MRSGATILVLILIALTGCTTPPAKRFEPDQTNVILPNQAVIFGKFLRAVDGETKADEERFFDLTPFKDTGHFSQSKYIVTADKEIYFYALVERDSYVIISAAFGTLMSMVGGDYFCYYLGFHMPEQADAYYIGTILFDLEAVALPLFSHRGRIYIRNEFEEAAAALKRRNPEFDGKIVESLVTADKSVPTRLDLRESVEPNCREKSTFPHVYEIIYE